VIETVVIVAIVFISIGTVVALMMASAIAIEFIEFFANKPRYRRRSR